MDSFSNFLNHPKLEPYLQAISMENSLVIEEVWESARALLLAAAFHKQPRSILLISQSEKLCTDLSTFGITPFEFPAWESLPNEEVAPSPDRVGERYRVLHSLMTDATPKVIVCSLQSLLQKLLPRERLKQLFFPISVGDEIPFSLLPDQLVDMGYMKRPIAADKGEFSVRGGLIDIYPVDSPDPFRLEFVEDRIRSIRTYDPMAQTSISRIPKICLTPGKEYELLHTSSELATLLDYVPSNTWIVWDQLVQLEDRYSQMKSMLGKKVRSFMELTELFVLLANRPTLFFAEANLESLGPVVRRGDQVEFSCLDHIFTAHRWRSPILTPRAALGLAEDTDGQSLFAHVPEASFSLCFLSASHQEEEMWKQQVPTAHVVQGHLSSGLVLLNPSYGLIPSSEWTGRGYIRRQKQRSYSHSTGSESIALHAGEVVVHMNNGIGRFLGIEKKPNHLGVMTEFLLVEYAEGSKLYIPMDQAHLVTKYIGTNEERPELHALGSTRWQRSREKTEQAILGYAKELLHLQAERLAKGGTACPPASHWIHDFEEAFPYEETPDQQHAIHHVYSDMESSLPMDRLVCGDVGYGKTEVAMRAAFKAVIDGKKQVAVLVPTTVLALQHYESFQARMGTFPIRIALLSRWQKPKEIRTILSRLQEGTIDLVIGTHRLLNEDVIFHDLGLMIIDEEQRFGVKAKEALKNRKTSVDCLTLSATPIPRTLYLSLVGARQLSCINTPPEDRLPIQSVVCQRNDELIKNALLRELARDGQAFVIHNRIESLFELANRIQGLVPGASVAAAHGQMGGDELDRVFHRFKSGETDILVATSIIENGIDIPNANTILIDHADRFGMAELYQMRGRVGRWNRKAYCYFMVSQLATLNEIARRRLVALSASSGQGAGMKIAMHDLELRGAGNILGTEQSGHVQAIGFHFYCKLLKKAVRALEKNQQPLFHTDLKLEFPYPAKIPENYIEEVSIRMDFYQRFGEIDSCAEADVLIEEMGDRFGPIPLEVDFLGALSKIRWFGTIHAFRLIKLGHSTLYAEQVHTSKKEDKEKGKKVIRTMLFRPPQTPTELATQILDLLSRNFPLLQPYPPRESG